MSEKTCGNCGEYNSDRCYCTIDGVSRRPDRDCNKDAWKPAEPTLEQRYEQLEQIHKQLARKYAELGHVAKGMLRDLTGSKCATEVILQDPEDWYDLLKTMHSALEQAVHLGSAYLEVLGVSVDGDQ